MSTSQAPAAATSALRQGLNSRQAETARKLMEAGLEELRAVGHEALTVRTVAQRAGVSPATAYTYLASKNHLFAELFAEHITDEEPATYDAGASTTQRVQQAARDLVARIVEEPELAAAVTPALLGADPDVARLRLRIGAEFVGRYDAALRDPARPEVNPDPAVLDTLVLTLSGALLQAGMGIFSYDQMSERLVAAVAVILAGTDRNGSA
ncbi:TetR/AcrR family transcriptional regulator [Nocardioides sp. AE5]|uniref:TetR/AcrR family transcriptional regulator n=1 Tax=Nocardioides sp. AE5 TaxID=2962573 RepID=UPI0028822321|nr:TetR/AcrR family transcriptional regulator [Nocardioides sp. AE5]MDT0202677.1 TetR/AcrR family transcriptional regulator [Nocardioides sp. AE5]